MDLSSADKLIEIGVDDRGKRHAEILGDFLRLLLHVPVRLDIDGNFSHMPIVYTMEYISVNAELLIFLVYAKSFLCGDFLQKKRQEKRF